MGARRADRDGGVDSHTQGPKETRTANMKGLTMVYIDTETHTHTHAHTHQVTGSPVQKFPFTFAFSQHKTQSPHHGRGPCAPSLRHHPSGQICCASPAPAHSALASSMFLTQDQHIHTFYMNASRHWSPWLCPDCHHAPPNASVLMTTPHRWHFYPVNTYPLTLYSLDLFTVICTHSWLTRLCKSWNLIFPFTIAFTTPTTMLSM